MAVDNPTAFISYSWDDDSHKDWVLGLASRLVENGVNVKLDRWDVPLGDSLTAFMESSVQNCDFTLVVCTPNYADRSLQRKGGVGYEQQIITGQIASGVPRSKFIPLIRSGSFNASDEDSSLPPHFLGIHALDMRGDVSDDTFEDLLRAIYKAPRLSPPALGRKPEFTTRETRTAVRLATLEIEGFYLNSGVVSAELYPDTFIIPNEAERQAVRPTDLVKLSFELQQLVFEDDDDSEEPEVSGERMWVEVTGSSGPYFVGRLRNQPASYVFVNPDDEKDIHVEKDAPLTFDSEVIFLPEHIISIQTAEEAEESRRRAGF